MEKKSVLLSFALATSLYAEQITSIEYINLTKISKNIANDTLGLRVGQELDIQKINTAIKEFYRQSYFDDINASMDNGKLQIIFKEKPSIANVDIVGYKQRENDIEMLKEQIGIKRGSMYSSKKVKKAKENLLRELEKEGYINSVVEVDIENLNENAVAVTFSVNKGDEIIIKKTNYYGSEALGSSDFERITANKEEDFASWFFTQNDGELKADQLEYDGKRIEELYLEHGYLDVKVENPFLEVDFASNQADLDFYIEEGTQYKTNTITIYLNSEILDPKEIYPELDLKKGRVFNIKKIRKDADYIKTLVADLGYAFTQVRFDIKKDEKAGTADIIFNVIPGEKVYIRDVKISGNSRTLDRVIRRNIYLAPGDLFNLTDFKDSKNKLRRSGFFDNVTLEQKRITSNEMDLIVKVKEAPTGNILLGGGYGSSDGIMISGSINEKNLFGSGIGLSFSAETSESEQDFTLKLTNPAIRDGKFSGDFEVHSTTNERDTTAYKLKKTTKGFSVGVGREIVRNLRAGTRYKLNFVKEDYTYEKEYLDSSNSKYIDPSRRFEDEEYTTSSIIPYIQFDNTNDYFFPTEGFRFNSSLEYAGLGGDSKFLKNTNTFKYFYSLEDRYDLDWIIRYKLQARFLVDNGKIFQGDSLYLGGVRTLRGFDSNSLGPDNDDGIKRDPYKAMAATSIEMSFPLIPSSKMRWGIFYDYGMIGEDDITQIQRSSTGALFEWISPFGPLQLIFAEPLDDKKGDDTSSFEFSLGQSF